ncbi:MAG: tetratricopeptide repeat protein [Candidatus Midichloria sp.]|nr:tetratricopeptide repeat protein [Candidatus Midichloria sp.]
MVLSWFKKSLDISSELAPINYEKIADIYLDIADFYANQQEIEKSLSHYEQALSICEQINSKEKVADILYSIGKPPSKRISRSASFLPKGFGN